MQYTIIALENCDEGYRTSALTSSLCDSTSKAYVGVSSSTQIAIATVWRKIVPNLDYWLRGNPCKYLDLCLFPMLRILCQMIPLCFWWWTNLGQHGSCGGVCRWQWRIQRGFHGFHWNPLLLNSPFISQSRESSASDQQHTTLWEHALREMGGWGWLRVCMHNHGVGLQPNSMAMWVKMNRSMVLFIKTTR